eukprot:gene21656-biopygen14710
MARAWRGLWTMARLGVARAWCGHALFPQGWDGGIYSASVISNCPFPTPPERVPRVSRSLMIDKGADINGLGGALSHARFWTRFVSGGSERVQPAQSEKRSWMNRRARPRKAIRGPTSEVLCPPDPQPQHEMHEQRR